ncbi:hypothetical protein G7046_g1714 [Stylonectria norvegica]|nr:hypothetical protein G7046_g1714 [Stylonectria norvegica]
MPSVRDKACQYSAQRNPFAFKTSRLSRNANTLTKWICSPLRRDHLLKIPSGLNPPGMPKVLEEQVFSTNSNPSPGSHKHHPTNPASTKPSTGSSPQSQSSRDAEDSGKDRQGSPVSSKSNPSSAKGHQSQLSSQCARILSVPLPSSRAGQPADITPVDSEHSTTTAAYLDYQINQQLRRRKKQIVSTLMAAILECLDKKLEALEEACDAQGSSESSTSRASSSASSSGNIKSKSAGQKRQLNRDEQEDNEDEDEDGARNNRDSKRAKTLNDDGRLKYACPYYKYDPERFQKQRTCCGPGWSEPHRVKEHLKRSHSLPKHQCNRCCRRFKEEAQLKAHQRETKPCLVKDPATVDRDLADGFDHEQDLKLQKRVKKTSAEKWKEWYCICFNLELDSPDIPSPYHDILGVGRSSIKEGNFQNYADCYRGKLIPLIHHEVEQEVEKAMFDVEDHIKSNVKDRIRDLPAILHRLIQSIPPPGGSLEADFPDMTAPEGFNPDNIFEDFKFDEADAFDFDSLRYPPYILETAETVESAGSSGSSNLSNSMFPAASSATSVDDDATHFYDPKFDTMLRQGV